MGDGKGLYCSVTGPQHAAQADPALAFFMETFSGASTSVSARHGSGRRGSLAVNR